MSSWQPLLCAGFGSPIDLLLLFSVNVLIWPSTEDIYWNAVRLMASDRNKKNRFEVEFFIVI